MIISFTSGESPIAGSLCDDSETGSLYEIDVPDICGPSQEGGTHCYQANMLLLIIVYQKTQLASQSIESVRSDGKLKLEQIESSMFQEV